MTDPIDSGAWSQPDPDNVAAASPISNPFLMGQTGAGASPYGASIYDDPGFRRHAAYSALTNMGLALMQASAPTTGPPPNIGSMFGSLGAGAASGVQSARDDYLKQMQLGMQMQNMRLRQQMLSAPLPVPQDTGGQPQQAAPGGPVAPAQQQTGQLESGGNPNAVNPVSGASGKYQFMPDTWAGVATKHPELNLPFNMKQASEPQQDAAKAALDKDNAQGLAAFKIPPTDANLYLAHRFGVGGAQQFLSQPDDVKLASFMPKSWIDQNADLQGKTVGQFKGKVDQNFPGTQLAQAGGNPQVAQGDGPQVAPGQQVAQAPPQAGLALPPMPKVIPYSPMAQRYIASGDKGLEALGKANNAQVDHLNAQRMERWKQNISLLQHNQTEARERQGMDIRSRNSDIGPDGLPSQPKIDFETQKEKAKKTADAETQEQNVFGGHGWQNVPNDQFRQRANPQLISLADGLQNGTVRASLLGTRTGPGGSTISKNDIIAAGQKLYGDKFNPDAGDIRYKFEQDIKDPDTQAGKTVYSLNTLHKHIDRFQDLILAQKNGTAAPLMTKIRKELNEAAGYAKYSAADALQPALATEIANGIKGAQLNMPEVEGAIELLKTTKSDPQSLETLRTLDHAVSDRESTFLEKAKSNYVPQERIDQIIGPSAKAARSHFNSVQDEYRAAHPEQFGGAPNAPAPKGAVRTFDPATGTLK